MTPRWEDANARVRGLGTRLLTPEALESLAAAGDLSTLARALTARGILPDESAASASEIDLALRRFAGREIGVLRHWLGDRDATLAVALDAEDRRSLRALIRGAAEGAPAEVRLAGLIPTPALPERLLRELAGHSRIRDQAALLIAAGHPYGASILATASEGEPDLFQVELAMTRTFAERAVHGSRRAGRFLRDYVASAIDRDNCRTALVLAASGRDEPAASAFVPGGRLAAADFDRAVSTGDPAQAARVLGAAAGAVDVVAILLRHARSPGAVEAALEDRVMQDVRRESRLDPLGPAPILLYLHRLRRQSAALSRILWGVDLGVPPSLRLPAGMEVA